MLPLRQSVDCTVFNRYGAWTRMRGTCKSCGAMTSRGRSAVCQRCYARDPALRRHKTTRVAWRFFCSTCGIRVSHGSKQCAEHSKARHRGRGNSNWSNFSSTNEDQGRRRARRRYRLGRCARCRKAPAIDRHHKDGNPFNNKRSNVKGLCRRCHMIVDGRASSLALGVVGHRARQLEMARLRSRRLRERRKTESVASGLGPECAGRS